MNEQPPKRLTPQEIILKAFEYFSASEMDEASLVKISLAANSPSETLAKQVLDRMVESNFLSLRLDEKGIKMY